MNFKLTSFLFLTSFTLFNVSYSENINIDELKKGKIITEEEIIEGRSGGVKATFWVNAKPEVVFRELSDGGKFSEFMPDIDVSIVKNSGENFQDVYYRLHFWFADVEYVLHRVIKKEERKITWNMLRGKFKRIDGFWEIKDGIDGSIVTYYTDVEPGLSVPKSISKYLTKKSLPDLVDAVRKRAESNGRWKKRD